MFDKLIFLPTSPTDTKSEHQVMNINRAIFRRSLMSSKSIMSRCADRRRKKELIEHFLRLAIEHLKTAHSVLDQEVVEIQDSEELNIKKLSSLQGPQKPLNFELFQII